MKIADALRLAGEAFLNALYPPHCAQCLADAMEIGGRRTDVTHDQGWRGQFDSH